MDLDDIVDISDLYLTSTNNGTDTSATTNVTDEEQVAKFHSESATDNASLTANVPSVDAILETITQNNICCSTS